LVVVVSEETGAISVAENGELTRGYTKESLNKLLTSSLIVNKDNAYNKERSLAGRMISRWKK
jgi:diadenylate cyclase